MSLSCRVLEEISSTATTAALIWLCLSPSRMPTNCVKICRAVVDIRCIFADALVLGFETSGTAEPLVLLWKGAQSSRDAQSASCPGLPVCLFASSCRRPRRASLAATNDSEADMPFHASVQRPVAHAMAVCRARASRGQQVSSPASEQNRRLE